MKYFMYHVMLYKDTIHHTLLRTFRNKEHLIDFLAFHQDIKGKYLDRDLHKIIYRNDYLDNINMTSKDTKAFTKWSLYPTTNYYLREYTFVDETGCVIDIRNWYDEIYNNTSPYKHYFDYDYHEKYKLTKQHHQGRHRHTDYAYRRLRYRHILRDKHDEENAAYIRAKAKNRLKYDCTGIRSISGSWKDQTKRKHQYKNVCM